MAFAQLPLSSAVEQPTVNRWVAGSNPAGAGSTYKSLEPVISNDMAGSRVFEGLSPDYDDYVLEITSSPGGRLSFDSAVIKLISNERDKQAELEVA